MTEETQLLLAESMGSAPRAELSSAEPTALCCCEYVNARGEVVHLLQLCCECSDLDALCDLSLRAWGFGGGKGVTGAARVDALDRALAEIDSRVRFAWPFGGGAVRIGLGGLLPPVLMAVGAVCAAHSFRGLVAAAIALPACAAFAHRRLLRLRRRNALLFSATLHAFALSGAHFFLSSVPRSAELSNVATASLAIAAVLALGSAHAPPLLCLAAGADAEAARAKARAHRCGVTGSVVERYDHHCAWIDQSVGRGNHRAFLLFAGCTSAASLANGAQALAGALATCSESGALESGSLAGLPGAVARCVRWHAGRGRGSLDLAVAALMGATALAVGALLLGQCLLVGRNLTAYEARHCARIGYLSHGNPFDRGMLANWLEFLAGAEPDSKLGAQSASSAGP